MRECAAAGSPCSENWAKDMVCAMKKTNIPRQDDKNIDLLPNLFTKKEEMSEQIRLQVVRIPLIRSYIFV
jgi:hypothetical protein